MFPGPLRAFHEMVAAGSMRRAGERLGLAPSSVGRQIAVLERMMGTSLIRRVSTGVELTHAGELVADYASAVVIDFDSLRKDLDDLRGRRGLIRVAVVESIVSGGPIAAAVHFRKSHEAVEFDFQMMPASQISEALSARTCDIGIGFCSEPSAQLVLEAQFQEPILLAVQKGHSLAGRASVEMHELQNFPIALPNSQFAVRRVLDRQARELGIELQPVLVANTFEGLRDFCRLGAGVTILPQRAVSANAAGGGLLGVPFAHSALNNTTLDLLRLKTKRVPRLIRMFIDDLKIFLR